MDPLSEVLALLKPRSYLTAGFDAGGDWALTLDDLAGRIKCYAVLRGECLLFIDGVEVPVNVVAGDCFVLPTGRVVTIASGHGVVSKLASQTLDPAESGRFIKYNGGGDVLLVGSRFEVKGRHAEFMLRTLPPLIQVKTSDDRAKLRSLIESMMEEFSNPQPGSALVSQHLSHMILVHALRLYLSERPSDEVGWLAALADPQLSAALSLMHAEPSSPWTLDRLAERIGMSRSVFARRFHERVGETPISYLTRWRMMLAGEKLTETADPVARIAESLGYTSEPAFSTAFRRLMGCSPRRYARENASAKAS